MGFFSKLMKNPIVQMALPMMLTGGATSLFSGTGLLGGSKLGLGLGSMFSGMNPMMANALKQSMLGYGTAALTGAKKPGKAAMYSGLASIPFSYMSAANAANTYNKLYGGEKTGVLKPGTGTTVKEWGIRKPLDFAGPKWLDNAAAEKAKIPFIKDSIRGKGAWDKPWADYWGKPKVVGSTPYTVDMRGGPGRPMYSTAQTIRPEDVASIVEGRGGKSMQFAGNVPKSMTELTVNKKIPAVYSNIGDPIKKVTAADVLLGKDNTKDIVNAFASPDGTELVDIPYDLDADIFTKFDPETGQSKMDMLGTLGPVGLGLLGEYVETEDERNKKEWEKNKERRRKELAWMYGVDPSMIEGEMDNPWNTGAFMNSGGIASLDMDLGGDVSGPGTGVSDSIDAKLSDGEFVMTAKAVENLGGGDRYEGARKMYDMMNMLDPESETMKEVV